MNTRISLGIGWAATVREGEASARAVIAATDGPSCSMFLKDDERHQWWIDTFGASEVEFDEMMEALAVRRNRTGWWRFGKRREITAQYARLRGLTTAAGGGQIGWM